MPPILTVIIPTRNRADLLRTCLESLCRQTLQRQLFEVVVVDNGSTDATPSVADDFKDRLNLRYVFEPEPGLHAGRHTGFRLARASILVYGDDDIKAVPTWLEAYSRVFQDPEVWLAGGNNLPDFEVKPPDWVQRIWSRSSELGQSLGTYSIIDFGKGTFEIDHRFVWGCNLAIRREAVSRFGGFHPDGMPDNHLFYRGDGESGLTRKLRNAGKRAWFDSDASVFHRVSADRMTPEYFEKRYYAQGISDSYSVHRRFGGRYPLSQIVLSQLRKLIWWMRERPRPGNRQDDVDMQLHSVLSRAQRAYWRAINEHRAEVSRDRQLKAWITRDDYFSTALVGGKND